MSTMEIELNSMNNTSDGSPAVNGSENEQKSITALDELLEQELKEDDSVDCFIKRVGDASEDSSEFGLNYEEAPVVSSSAFYSPKEDTSTDNNSLLEKELEDTLNKGQEVPLTSDTDNLPSGEEESAEEETTGEEETAGGEETAGEETMKDDTPATNTCVEDTNEGTKDTEDKGEDELPSKVDTDFMQNEENEESMITEEADNEVKEQVDEKDSALEEEAKQKETSDTVPHLTEVKSPSKPPNSDTDQKEKDTDGESTKAEGTKESHKDVLYLVFHPKEQGNKNGEKAKESPVKLQCSETSTTSGNVIKITTGADKSVAKAVLSVASGSETNKGQEVCKSIIVKKITTKIVKDTSPAITKATNESEVNDSTSKQPLSSTTASEPEEQPQNKSDDTKGESEKQTLNDDTGNVKTEKPRIVLTKKVYGNRRSPRKAKIPTTEDGSATIADTQDHHNNVDHGKGNEEKTLSDKLEVNRSESGESTEKRTANVGTLKRKFEEICRISREEEGAAIEEIKKMKKETLDVLKKINAEMEKLKKVFLARK